VVIPIAGLIGLLLLPAIQKVRESANPRRSYTQSTRGWPARLSTRHNKLPPARKARLPNPNHPAHEQPSMDSGSSFICRNIEQGYLYQHTLSLLTTTWSRDVAPDGLSRLVLPLRSHPKHILDPQHQRDSNPKHPTTAGSWAGFHPNPTQCCRGVTSHYKPWQSANANVLLLTAS